MKKIFLGLIAFLGLSSSFCISSSALKRIGNSNSVETMNKFIKENPKKSLVAANFTRCVITGAFPEVLQLPVFALSSLGEYYVAERGNLNFFQRFYLLNGLMTTSLILTDKQGYQEPKGLILMDSLFVNSLSLLYSLANRII